MANLKMTRRGAGMGLLGAGLPWQAAAQAGAPAPGPGPDESHLGSLYPFVQKRADSSPVALSFLRPEFRSLQPWQTRARTRIFERLLDPPAAAKPDAEVVRR